MEGYGRSDVIDVSALENGGVTSLKKSGKAPRRFIMEAHEKPDGTFVDKECIKFFLPGGDEIVRKVKPGDIEEFPREYEAFKKGLEQVPEGEALEKWDHPFMTPAMVRNLQNNHIMTVEQLSEMPDTTLQLLGMGAREVKNAAMGYISAKSGSAELDALKATNETLMERLSALESQLEATPKRKTRKKVANEQKDAITDNSGRN